MHEYVKTKIEAYNVYPNIAASSPSRIKKFNKLQCRAEKLLSKLEISPADFEAFYTNLASHENVLVRLSAAMQLIKYRPELAKTTLQEIAGCPSYQHYQIYAEMALFEAFGIGFENSASNEDRGA